MSLSKTILYFNPKSSSNGVKPNLNIYPYQIISIWMKKIQEIKRVYILESESESEILLVVHRMAFIYQDLWYGKLISSSHKKGKLSHTIPATIAGK